MNKHKLQFFGLIFICYVALFWVLPAFIVEPQINYILNVAICHGIVLMLVALAGAIGYLFEKAYGC